MNEILIVDSINEDIVKLEKKDGTIFLINKSDLPDNIKEGDVVKENEDGYYIDDDMTETRKIIINRLEDELFNN